MTSGETSGDGAVSSAHELQSKPSSQDQGFSPAHAAQQQPDIEGRTLKEYTESNDPFSLSSRLKSQEELDQIRANISRKRDGYGPITFNQKAHNARKLQKFYKSQNDNIQRLLTPVDEHVRTARETQNADKLKVKIGVYGSFVANLLLAVLQVYAASSSLSLSLFTTMADALFDPLSNVTLLLCNKTVKKVDGRKFPSGKARIETVGNICFCFLMTSVSWILIVVSVIEIVNGSDDLQFHVPSVVAVGVALLTKTVLFLYCWTLRKTYSQIEILWEDHRNDIIINAFGLFTSIAGSKLNRLWDPIGAIALAVLISTLWLRTAYKEFQLLIGISANTQMLQWITYISMTHSPIIKAIDTVRAYHSGPRLVAEVDVVIDPNETVQVAHDVAEELQTKLESLPNVERCYVHIDFETSHKPEHFLKKEL